MSSQPTIVLASHNPGKAREYETLLSGYTVILAADKHINAPEETGLTFIENAILKARHASAACNLPAIGDDAGLCVDALHGAPGLYSARYAGTHASDTDNLNKLLDTLGNEPNREAYFYCAIAWVAHANDPAPRIGLGRFDGVITTTPAGCHGFGYDPIFFIPTHNKTAAELNPAVKNTISHRALAMADLLTKKGA